MGRVRRMIGVMQTPATPEGWAKEALYLGLIGAVASLLLLSIWRPVGVVGLVLTALVVVGLLCFAGIAKAVQVGVRPPTE